jgi:cation:H+ antiporter
VGRRPGKEPAGHQRGSFELSTGLTSVKNRDYQPAVSDIFGGTAYLPVLLLMASLISGRAVLPQAQDADIYRTAQAALLTLAYMAGLLFRPGRRIARMGGDSLTVLVLYVVGVAGLSPRPAGAACPRMARGSAAPR